MDKASLRKDILSIRDRIPLAVKEIKDKSIEAHLFNLNEFNSAKTISFFASFRSEVDTLGMIKKSLDAGITVVLPRVEGRELVLYQIKGLHELVPVHMGIPEPSVLTDDRKINVNDVDAIIIPGAAFDETGNRIGYGGGFYDRMLAQLQKPVPIIAPTYEEQVIKSVPTDPHDRKVNIIVTDIREIRCI